MHARITSAYDRKGSRILKIDITEILNRRRDEIAFDYSFSPEEAELPCAELPPDAVFGENSISVKGMIRDYLGAVLFEADVRAEYTVPCARCLEPVTGVTEFRIERTVIPDQQTASRDTHVREDGEWDGQTDDFIVLKDMNIIPDAEILEELSDEMPMYVLCSPDCPGLCPKCGKPLRAGDCGCAEEKYVNPQMAALAKLLENNET